MPERVSKAQYSKRGERERDTNNVGLCIRLDEDDESALSKPIWISLNTTWFGPLSECHRTFIFIPFFLHTVQRNGFYRCALCTSPPPPTPNWRYIALCTLVWSFPSGKCIPALDCLGMEADFFGVGCSVLIRNTAEGKANCFTGNVYQLQCHDEK